LSRFPSLFVIARNSSFTYKGRAVDAKHLGRELGVRYVLEGSIRKSANRVRIAAQLSEATNASQIWGERFEGSLPDIFLLQDELVERVVGSLVPQIEQAEIERAERQDHPKLTAYDFYLRALAKYYGHGREENEAAIHLLTKATEADPTFGLAYALHARCYHSRRMNHWMLDERWEVQETERPVNLAVLHAKSDALAHAAPPMSYVLGHVERASALIDRAIAINPNCAVAFSAGSFVKARCGEGNLAVEFASRAIRLSPRDPMSFVFNHAMACALLFAGRPEEAIKFGELSVSEKPMVTSFKTLAVSYARAGRLPDAQEAVRRAMELFPDAKTRLVQKDHFRSAATREEWDAALKIVGWYD
jgi:tetratricopeptide (TPR) repeat protein